MKYMKMFEEFQDDDISEDPIKLTDNEINYLMLNSDYNETPFPSINSQLIEKYSDGWYVLRNNYRCSSLKDAVKLSEQMHKFTRIYGPRIISKILHGALREESSSHVKKNYYVYSTNLIYDNVTVGLMWYESNTGKLKEISINSYLLSEITFMDPNNILSHVSNISAALFDLPERFDNIKSSSLKDFNEDKDIQALIDKFGFKIKK